MPSQDISLSFRVEEAELLEAYTESLQYGSVSAAIKQICGLPLSERDRRRLNFGPQELSIKPERQLNNNRLRYTVTVIGDQLTQLQDLARQEGTTIGIYMKRKTMSELKALERGSSLTPFLK